MKTPRTADSGLPLLTNRDDCCIGLIAEHPDRTACLPAGVVGWRRVPLGLVEHRAEDREGRRFRSRVGWRRL